MLTPLLLALLGAAALYLYTPDKPRRRLEARYAQPPSQFVTVKNTRLHIRDTGPPGAPALLFIHGFAASLQTWDAWSEALNPDFRTIRFDLPGFGLSAPDAENDYGTPRALAMVTALLDHLAIPRATLIGNSLGGNLAWHFAAAHPHRTDKLVLIAPAGFRPPGPPGKGPARIPLAIRMMRFILPMPLLRRNMQASYADPAKLTPALMKRYRDMLLAPGIRPAILERMRQMSWDDPVPILRSIGAPTLLLWGERDRLVPVANADDYLAALPHAQLVVLPNEGHAPQEEVPQASLVPLKRFLASTANTREDPA